MGHCLVFFAFRAPLPTLPEQNLSQHNLNKLDVQLRKWREGTMVRKSLQPWKLNHSTCMYW